jgi:hypothetical protein
MIPNTELPQSLRLHFRHLQVSDVAAWEAFVSNPEAVRFFPPGLNVTQSAVGWIERQLNRYRADGFGLNALIEKESGALVGQCGLLRQEVDGIQELEIGYHLLPRSGKKDLPPKPRMPAGFLHSSTTWRIPLFPSFTRKISHRSALRSAMECKGKRKRSGAGQRLSFIAFVDHETKKAADYADSNRFLCMNPRKSAAGLLYLKRQADLVTDYASAAIQVILIQKSPCR